jgi:uncharacterized membrane protein
MLPDPSYYIFCKASAAFNCEIVYQSLYATFHGVPVALFGVIWFTLALLLTLADAAKSGREESGAVAYLFLVSMPALSLVLFFAYASIVILKVLCIVCALTYLAVLGVFVISGAAPNTPLAGLPQQVVRDARALAARPLALGVAVVFLAGTVSALVLFSRPRGDSTAALAAVMAEQPNDFDLWFEELARVPIPLPNDGAQVLIVQFTDYQCAACAEAFRTDGPVLAKYQKTQPGKVKLVLMDDPLDPQCNPDIAANVHETHDAACEAAVAVRLARRQQRGAAMQEWLYAHQAGLTPEAVRRAAMEIGGVTDFDSEFPRVVALIKADVDLGRRLGVRGTPTLFINGARIEGGLKPGFLDQAIAHELRVRAKP